MALIETRRDFAIFKISGYAFCNRFSFDFSYLAIHIKLLSYFFCFPKSLSVLGFFWILLTFQRIMSTHFFPLCVSVDLWIQSEDVIIQKQSG